MPNSLEDPDEETFRCILSTDNHLGYLERDPVRGNDSFCAFEEVLFLAKKYKADCVLLAGDLFHNNKPSRRTLHKTMDILKRYTLGADPVKIQILSDGNFRDEPANYLSQFVSVDLPIFSIHGNHDDPTREGGDDLLAALDLLSVSSLVNYFGRQDLAEKIDISPILLQKGEETKLAIYGMGSLREERLNRMWQGKKVRFTTPSEGEWFSIFLLHQNRDVGRGSKNCVHESMIPEWMDLVVWGHEHECRIDPQESVVGTFRITQPGSSVATSLSIGESIRKQIGVLDIRANQFRLHPLPLTQVRAFCTGEIRLDVVQKLDPEDPKVEVKMSKELEEQVQVLIHDARKEYKELLHDAAEEGNDPEELRIQHKLNNPKEVLVRLRVEHTGFSTLSNQRFGAKFVGDVANPSDILLFHRSKAANESSVRGKKKRAISVLDRPMAPADLEELNVEDLIKENLEMGEKRLELLSEKKLSTALDDFVTKEHNKSIKEAADVMLEKQQKSLIQKKHDDEDDGDEGGEGEDGREEGEDDYEMEDGSSEASGRSKTSKKRRVQVQSDEEESPPAKRSRKKRQTPDRDSDDEMEPPPKKTASRKRKEMVVEVGDSDDDPLPPPLESKHPNRRTMKTKPKYAEEDNDDESEPGLPDDHDEVLEGDDSEEEPEPKKVRGLGKKRPVASHKSTSQSQLSFTSTRPKRGARRRDKKRSYAGDGESDDDFGPSFGVDEDWGSARTRTTR